MKEKEKLSQVYLFRELTPSEIDTLLSISQEKRAQKDEVIFKEGATGDAFYFIVSGSIRISTMVPGVGEEALTILREGEYFGEMAAISNEPRSASIVSKGRAVVKRFPGDKLPEVIQKYPDVAKHLFEVSGKRLVQANNVMLKLAKNRVKKTGKQPQSS